MNILSIDFDIIMAPDINLYNDMITPTEDHSKTFDKIKTHFPLLDGVRADLKHYQKIVVFLMSIIDSIDVGDIRVSYNHEDIKYMLEGLSDVHIFNIDHHHDLGYISPHGVETPCDICNCSNWVRFFIDNGTIESYTWINNSNSAVNINPKYMDYLSMYDLKTYNLKDLPKIDKVFICLSSEWIPERYYPLFYTLIDLINYYKHCKLEIR
jgi:hypothetical protein